MKKQSKGINKRLESWINNRLFKTLNPKDWEIESILYIYNNHYCHFNICYKKKKTVIFEGGVNKVSTLADGTLSINIHTQELPEETMMRVFSLRKSPGMVLISSDDISKAEVEEVEKFTTDFEVGKTKTASQRLRAVLYRVWEQGDQNYDFVLWYESQMERIINKYKTTLEQ